jgi:DNA topoisomerase-6 subunit B
VYRGNPFIIEAGLAFGKGLVAEGATPAAPTTPLAEGEQHESDDELARVIRYANRVPLLYQQSACATFKAVLETAWRNYGIAQSRGALPAGPMVIFVHMASVWVPFTSESKEAIADYDEIRKDIKLALQECGRRLGVFLRRRERAKSEFRRRNIFELYIEEVVEACARLKGGKLAKEKLKTQLHKIAAKRTGGARTDEILGRDTGPEGLPHSIIVTPDGPEGEAPVLPSPVVDTSAGLPVETDAPAKDDGARKSKVTPAAKSKATAAGKHTAAAGKRAPRVAKHARATSTHAPAAKHGRAPASAKRKKR